MQKKVKPQNQKAPLWKRATPGLLAGVVNGLFGGGGGLLLVPMLRRLSGLETHKAHATAIVTTACLSIVSLIVYLNRGVVDWELAVPLAMGGAVGSAIGALCLNRVPTKLLRKGFAHCLLFSAWRMYVG